MAEAPGQQVLLALAMLRIESLDAAKILREKMIQQRTPPKWRRIHAKVDQANRALAKMKW